MKKKIIAFCVVLSLAVVAIIGGTLAYFTDTKTATNVFTTGDVEIELNEIFDKEDATLVPGVDIQKEVKVKNTGSEDAYVRVHIAIPSMLDSGKPEFAAYNNTLHFNFTEESCQEGKWSQLKNAEAVGPNSKYPNWPGNGGDYNMYVDTIGGIEYNVYVFTYESVLKAEEETTTPAINKVYLDTKVTNKMMENIVLELGENPKILVAAEGGQEAGFDNAYDALNTQFGVPGTYNLTWTTVEAA